MCGYVRRARQGYLTVVFFFQAEDGIRDATVTGVQTCALPISILFVMKSTLCTLSVKTVGRNSPRLNSWGTAPIVFRKYLQPQIKRDFGSLPNLEIIISSSLRGRV